MLAGLQKRQDGKVGKICLGGCNFSAFDLDKLVFIDLDLRQQQQYYNGCKGSTVVTEMI